jgi:hypothetical protein
MKRRCVLVLLGLLPLAASAQMPDLKSLGSQVKDPLTSMLSSNLGVTENQAKGGVGSILVLAQEKLIKGDFDKVAAAIPGASSYVATAKQLGAVTGPIKDMAGLKSALAKLGMSPAVTSKFIPAVSNYVGKVGGSEVGSLLSSVLH